LLSFWISNPAFGLALPTIFTGTLFLAGIVELGQPLLSKKSMVYFYGGIISALIIFFLSIKIIFRRSFRNIQKITVPGNTIIRSQLRYLNLFIVLGLLGGIFTAIDFYMSFSLNFGYNLEVLRLTFSEREASFFSYSSNILIPFSSIALGLTLLFYENIPRWKRLMGLGVGIIIPVFCSLGLGGRAYIFDLLIIIPWWLLQRPAWGRPIFPPGIRWRAGLLFIFPIGLLVLSSISVSRSAYNIDQYKFAILINKAKVSPTPKTIEFIEATASIDPRLAVGITESLLYWTGPLAVFDKMFYHWDINPTYVSAFSQVLHRRLESLDIIPSISKIWMNAGNINRSYGFFPKTFYTTPFSLIVSFGKICGFIIQPLLMFLATLIFIKSWRQKHFMYNYMASLFFLSFLLWFQAPISYYPLYEYGSYYCLIFILFRSITNKANKKTRTSQHSNSTSKWNNVN